MKDSNRLIKNEGYELEELIATDSWGELHRAIYVPHRRPVLFRRFAGGLSDEEPWQLAAAEVQAWARVDHPGVLQPLDWGNPSDGPFAVTAMPAGSRLQSLVSCDGPPGDVDPGAVFAGIVDAVEAARRFGVLHLGLGPANIWVSPEGAVQVSDFGLWYVCSEFPGVEGPDELFLAPEQSSGGRVSAATDVYALGLILVALHHGRDGARLAASGDVSSLTWRGEAAASLAACCLRPDPLDRPRSAGHLLAEGHEARRHAQPAYRDCPICRLKDEIARDLGLRRRTVAERLLDLDSDNCEPSPRPVEVDDRQPAEKETSRRLPTTIESIFPWIAIAALALVTVGVWWLAFR
ncbi:MAG: protein kinase domain-containing protein [Candidatus Geothermincolia bacterium]